VATAPVDRAALGERVPEDAEVRVVAPASDVSPLQWLASDEDEARAEAAEVAEEAGAAVGGEAEVGDPDPVQAIEDALRQYPADEILVVTRSDEEAGWLEEGAVAEARERFGVPLTHLALDA
jgi:nucleotide-binding universal stress UspA family protein